MVTKNTPLSLLLEENCWVQHFTLPIVGKTVGFGDSLSLMLRKWVQQMSKKSDRHQQFLNSLEPILLHYNTFGQQNKKRAPTPILLLSACVYRHLSCN